MKITHGSLLAAVLIAFLSTLIPLAVLGASPADDDYNISVRSSVDQAYTRFSKEPVRSHGKLYAIISFEQVKMPTPLVKPVNQVELFKQLQKSLAAYGFQEPAAGTNPQIVLTVIYGRAWLVNPYLKNAMEEAKGSTGDFGGAQVVTLDLQQVILEKSIPGFQEKAQGANGEKLFIAVTAWKFPATPKEKPQKAWQTVMVVNDADMDLNQTADKMLAAGARYFDHPLGFEKLEESISSRDATAHVIVGAPTVVEPAKSGK